MNNDFRELSASPRTESAIFSEVPPSSLGFLDEANPSSLSIESHNKKFTEEHRRRLIDEEIGKAHEQGFWVCRLWQLVVTLNVVVVVVTVALALLLLFSIGPLGKNRRDGTNFEITRRFRTVPNVRPVVSKSVVQRRSRFGLWSRIDLSVSGERFVLVVEQHRLPFVDDIRSFPDVRLVFRSMSKRLVDVQRQMRFRLSVPFALDRSFEFLSIIGRASVHLLSNDEFQRREFVRFGQSELFHRPGRTADRFE